jgi:hypothetical protein
MPPLLRVGCIRTTAAEECRTNAAANDVIETISIC